MPDNALGKGLDALIQKPKTKKKTKRKETVTKSVQETNTNNLAEDKIITIKEDVKKNPRISLWSAKSAACLRYLKKTTPEFSISNEASDILEEAIAKKYPEIWELFEDI